ncbi:MAG: ankyrin repeat domain-containing protein [Bacteroidales bacterium]|nr:ankyrin repeat domain-containing protein [Bacteroidales bacterium]
MAEYSKLSPCYKVLILLLENGANVNSQKKSGQTALHSSINYENFKVTELLLKYRGDINIKDTCGISPLDIAIKHNNKQMLELINKYSK